MEFVPRTIYIATTRLKVEQAEGEKCQISMIWLFGFVERITTNLTKESTSTERMT